MSGFGITPNIQPPTGPQPAGKAQRGDPEAWIFAVLLSILGVNSKLIRTYYMKRVETGQKWLNAANGVNGVLSKNPGDITNQDWDDWGNGFEFLERQLAFLKKNDPNSPLIKGLETIVNYPGFQKLLKDLKALQAAENQVPVNKAKVAAAKKALNAQLLDIQNPTTTKGQTAATEAKNALKNLIQNELVPANAVIEQEAKKLINNIKYLATMLSNMMKKFQGVSEMINSMTLK